MARIRKEDHARILEMVDVEERKVAEVAVEFGCTTANIYALLGKIRRSTFMAEREKNQAALPELVLEPEPDAMPARAETNVVTFERTAPVPEPKPVAAVKIEAKPIPQAETTPEPMREAKVSKLGAKLAKPGVGLVMRTADGEESMSPFRSLDDLLSAIKPILRATARNADPVWFSLQSVDLSAIEIDAA